jgi:signal peptidase I
MKKELTVCKQLLKSALKKGKRVESEVSGQSMQPLIQPGKKILVEFSKPEQLSEGDLIVFENPASQQVVHRIIKVGKKQGEKCFITKGDANAYTDLPIKANQIVGKVITIKPDIDLTSKYWQRKSKEIARISRNQLKYYQPLNKILRPLSRIKIKLIGRRNLFVRSSFNGLFSFAQKSLIKSSLKKK